jgi:DNA-binding CsgD family transcriptional regulator/tetratricopeptide (TPR) repeat protein
MGSAVLVAGEAGIGKSRLISELAARARASGVTVLVGECIPVGEGELPYAPIVGALRSLVRERGSSEFEVRAGSARDELARLLPELATTGARAPDGASSDGSQMRLFEQLLSVLARASEAAPVVLVVEDIHWSDRSTRDFLAFLVRATRRERLAVIASYRSDEIRLEHAVRRFVSEFERSGQAIRVQLLPFTRAELGEQVAAILGGAAQPAVVDGLLARSEGNPFFAEELLASSDDGGAVLPESLRDALLLRLEGQAPLVRRVLQIAAVAGRLVDHLLLAAVAGLGDEELTAALRGAVSSQVLVHDPASTGYAFRHALLREAVYADLLPGERYALHLELARALAKGPELAGPGASTAAELAYHYYAAGRLPEALKASVRAGIAAERVHALAEALSHYERALELWNDTSGAGVELPLGRVEVMRRAAQAANLAGATERAVELARATLERIDARRDRVAAALAHERLGRYLWIAGRGEQALPEYRCAVELVPSDPPSRERAYVLAAEGQILMLGDRCVESATRCEEALKIAQMVDAEPVQAHVLNTICANLSSAGDFDGAVAAAAQARAIARPLGLVEEIGRSYINGSDALDVAGHLEASIALAREGIDAAGELGARDHGDRLRGDMAGRLLHLGRWAEADELLSELLDRGPAGLPAANAYIRLAYLRAEQGDSEEAHRILDHATDLVTRSGGSLWLGPAAETKATIELWMGRPDRAVQTVADCLATVRGSERLFSTARLYELGTRAHADLATVAPKDQHVPAGDAASALLERVDALIVKLPGATPPLVLASRATCAAERSRITHDQDAHVWDDARRLWEAIGHRYLAAYARWRQAETLLTSVGDRRSSESLIREASAVADALGARPLAGELKALARRARIDLNQSDSASQPTSVAPKQLDLTPREIEVLTLLADGLTNHEIARRLFISDRTASVHVSHILTKLSVPNRAAAAATAYRLGIAGESQPTAAAP